MRFQNLARSIVIPAALVVCTALQASDKEEQYIIRNKTENHVFVICGNWINSPIILHKGNREAKFKSKKFKVMHVITLDRDGNFFCKDYLAENVPGFKKGERYAFDEGGTYEVTADGLSRIS